jgi:hypothetical protein
MSCGKTTASYPFYGVVDIQLVEIYQPRNKRWYPPRTLGFARRVSSAKMRRDKMEKGCWSRKLQQALFPF